MEPDKQISMLSLETILVIFVTYMVITYYLVGWKYKNYPLFSPSTQRIFDLIHLLIVVSNILFFISFAYLAYLPGPWSVLKSIGLFFFAVGTLLIIASVKALGKATFFQHQRLNLICNGPYRYVRHPIYSGGIIGSFGLCVLTESILLAIYLIVLIIMLKLMASREESELQVRFGDKYKQYAKTTGMFIPSINTLSR